MSLDNGLLVTPADGAYFYVATILLMVLVLTKSHAKKNISQCAKVSSWVAYLPEWVPVWDEYLDIKKQSNIFGKIYSFPKIFGKFSMCKFIWIFVCDVFTLRNIFGYSFVNYLWKQIYSDFHLS